ncbi:hypothetical protein OXX80_007190 [Metschnikowia pulcherrima]
MNILSLLLSFCFLLNLGSAFFARSFRPSKDDFYKDPENIASYKEGEIIKWRDTPRRIRSIFIPNFKVESAWQFMVKSTNTHGEPIGIVGTLIKPKNADPSKLVAYNYFTDSASVDCAPSYSILFGAGVSTVSTQAETLVMNQALDKGWYVVATDYQGQKAAFGASILGGHAVLDGIRGALSSGEKSELKSDAKVAIWGFSGGTIPSAWAGALQPKYAPELSENLIGVAVGGWATNLTSVIETIDGKMYAGMVGSGILGIATEYPEVEKDLFNHVNPWKARKLRSLYNKCVTGTMLSYFRTKFFKGRSPVFTEGEAFFRRPEIKAIMDENTLAVDESGPVPQVPFFVYHGEPDELVPFHNAQRVYDMWCSQGIKSMEFAVSETSDHTKEFAQGAGAAVSWLTKIFNGQGPVDGCERTVRKSNLEYPGADTESIRATRGKIEGVVQKLTSSFAKSGGDEKSAESSLDEFITEEVKATPQEAAEPGEDELESPEELSDDVSEEPEEPVESGESEEQPSEDNAGPSA